MNSNVAPYRYIWIITIIMLVGCGKLPMERVFGVTATSVPSHTPAIEISTALPTVTPYPPTAYTVVSSDTCESIADTFKVSIENIIDMNNLSASCIIGTGQILYIPYSSASPPRPSPTPSLIPTPISEFPLDGYVIAFIKEGDLYFQDGENLPIKLTHVGEKARYGPEISSDNQKILFYRREGNDDIAYSINTDGTNERVVMPESWLDSLEPGTKKYIQSFIPLTHQLLIRTYLCESTEFGTPCSAKLFIADTDTTAVEELANLGLAYQQNTPNGNVRISPDGKLIAVGTMDGLRILTLDGEIIRDDILGYEPSSSSELFPSPFWLSDSSGLIVVLPDALYPTNAYGDFIAHTVWRYSVKENSASQISLNPPLMGFNFDISADGKWAIYGGFSGYDTELYLADLTTGHVQIFGNDLQPGFWWGLDSKHFAYGTAFQNLSTVDNPFSVTNICDLLQWVDTKHFLCRVDAYGAKLRMGEFEGENIKIYNLGLDEDVEFSVFVKPE